MLERIIGREAFLANLTSRKQFPDQYQPFHPSQVSKLPYSTLADKSTEELIEVARERAAQVYAGFITTTKAELPWVIADVIEEKGGGQALVPNLLTESRFAKFGLVPIGNPLVEWQYPSARHPEVRDVNIAAAAKSNICVAFADWFAAESCSSVVVTGPGQGRALHFLPTHYISIVPASVIVPRTTQVAQDLNNDEGGMGLEITFIKGRAIHFISGPSNSADIELELVVGLHGPLSVTYLIVTDA